MSDLLAALDRLNTNVSALNTPGADPEARRTISLHAVTDAAVVAVSLGVDLLIGGDGKGHTTLAFTAA